jgi:competence protein ComFB
MVLKNIMEEIVENKLHQKLEGTSFCKCEICFGDMMAIALNILPAQYVNTDKGELITKVLSMEQQNNVDIDVATIKAVKLVSGRPRCGAKVPTQR